MQVLGVIPARGGSKGVPGKNLRELGGRPLLAYTADAVKASKRITRAIVSTDDDRIAECARSLGLDVPFMCPPDLASDAAPMVPVLQHAVQEMGTRGCRADVVVLLQPTSPLRRAEHIDRAIDLLVATGADTVVSVVEVPHQFTPGSLMRLDGDRLQGLLDAPAVLQRQQKPTLYARNGPAVLAIRAEQLARGAFYSGDTRALVMPAEDSLDIDTAWDFELLECVLARRGAHHVR